MSYQFLTTKKVESKTCSGVSFTVRTITESVRNQVRAALSAPLAEMRDAQAQLEVAFVAAQDNVPMTAEQIASHYKARDHAEEIEHLEVMPAWLRVGFVSVDGLEVDGQPFTGGADALMASAPESLIDEIVKAIKRSAQMTETERKNSEPSTTSAAVVDGVTKDTTAAPAKNPASTALATA